MSFDTELPFDYYSLPFCTPAGGVQKSTSSVNPGTILSGLRMFSSPYEFKINVRLPSFLTRAIQCSRSLPTSVCMRALASDDYRLGTAGLLGAVA